MPKNIPSTASATISGWLSKKSAAASQSQENEKDEAYNKRLLINTRIKEVGIKPKMTVKAKLQDDLRAFEYTVQKIDKESGEVFLKNERATVRKLSVFDKLFGPDAKTRTR